MQANRQSDSTMLTVLIPAYNEADRIAETLDGVMAALEGAGVEGAQVLVIDDGSSDDTAAAAASRPGVEVFRLEGHRGTGGALNVGLRQARGKIIVTLDADLGASAAEMGCLLAPVFAGEAEMTIAAFPAAGRSGGLGCVVGLARWAVHRATGQDVSAPLSGQRAMTRALIDAVGGFEEGFGVETALTIEALRRGFRVRVVPTTMRHRALGRTPAGFLHRGKQLLSVARVVWRKRAWRRQER